MTNDNIYLSLASIQDAYQTYRLLYPEKHLPEEPFFFQSGPSVNENLNHLSLYALRNPTIAYYCYKPIFLELVARLIQNASIFESEYSKSFSNNSVQDLLSLQHFQPCLTLHQSFWTCLSTFAEFEPLDKNRYCEHTWSRGILLAYYRTIHFGSERFRQYINAEVIYRILESSGQSQVSKYLCVEILTIYLLASEQSRNEMLEKYVSDDELISKYDDESLNYRFLALSEAKRISTLKLARKGIFKWPNTGMCYHLTGWFIFNSFSVSLWNFSTEIGQRCFSWTQSDRFCPYKNFCPCIENIGRWHSVESASDARRWFRVR